MQEPKENSREDLANPTEKGLKETLPQDVRDSATVGFSRSEDANRFVDRATEKVGTAAAENVATRKPSAGKDESETVHDVEVFVVNNEDQQTNVGNTEEPDVCERPAEERQPYSRVRESSRHAMDEVASFVVVRLRGLSSVALCSVDIDIFVLI